MPTEPEQPIDDCSNCGNHQQGYFNKEPCKSCLDHVNKCFEENSLIYYINWTPLPKKPGDIIEVKRQYGESLSEAYAKACDARLAFSNDEINHPAHHCHGGIECIDYLKAKLTTEEFIGYLKGNCIKYLSRMGHKDAAVKEAGKAAWYANRLKKELDG